MKILFAIILASITPLTFAQKIVVTGKPIELQVNKGNYTFPDTYYDRNKGYHYITLMETERVCFLQANSNLRNVDNIAILIIDNGRTLPWTCYRYDPKYFEKDY